MREGIEHPILLISAGIGWLVEDYFDSTFVVVAFSAHLSDIQCSLVSAHRSTNRSRWSRRTFGITARLSIARLMYSFLYFALYRKKQGAMSSFRASNFNRRSAIAFCSSLRSASVVVVQ